MKTTRVDVMTKSLIGKTEEQVFDLCAKYFNELANGYFFEHEVVTKKGKVYRESESDENYYRDVLDFCNEISYWLSCYYEYGNIRHDAEYNDRKAFIKFLKVFQPYCKEEISNRWIPHRKETAFLFGGL